MTAIDGKRQPLKGDTIAAILMSGRFSVQFSGYRGMSERGYCRFLVEVTVFFTGENGNAVVGLTNIRDYVLLRAVNKIKHAD
ncbi:hypothetical protein J6590_079426 [Homalodisca vitripennis]|nr:hypothetical protein J6590_079426 [Homalodisca vitripennis]